MALNPPLIGGGIPAGVYGETYLLTRRGICLDMRPPGQSKIYAAESTLYLTTKRIVVVLGTPVSSGGQVVTAVDIPLEYITEEDFKQPIFGSNYLTGMVAPIRGMGLSSRTRFYLYFQAGNAGTFLRFFLPTMGRYREAGSAAAAAEAERAAMAAQLREQAMAMLRQSQAYMMPGDPSVLYVAQPQAFFVGRPYAMAGAGPYGGAGMTYGSAAPTGAPQTTPVVGTPVVGTPIGSNPGVGAPPGSAPATGSGAGATPGAGSAPATGSTPGSTPASSPYSMPTSVPPAAPASGGGGGAGAAPPSGSGQEPVQYA